MDKSDLPRDALPYTDEFDQLKHRFEKDRKATITDLAFWRMLSSIGKGGGLGKKSGKKKAPRTPTLSAEEQLEILRLMPDGIGNRDHLPYTPKFDDLHRRFAKLTGKKLSKHELWRGVSRVAKLSRKPKPLFETAPLGGLDKELVEFVEFQNPWWKAQPAPEAKRFKRWAFEAVVDRLQSGLEKIVVIRGSRRVGKSVIQNQLVERLLLLEKVNPAHIFYVQFDEIPKLGTMTQPILSLVRWYEDNVLKCTLNAAARRGEPAYLLFDEIQNLSDWAVQLKALVDHTDVKTLVTGSSAMRLAENKHNASRMTWIELGPLRLTEIAGMRRLKSLPAFADTAKLEDWKTCDFWLGLIAHGKKHAKERDEAYRLYSERGGYPLCHSTSEQDVDKIRQQVIDEVITKTINFDPPHRARTHVLDVPLVSDTFRLACRYAGESPRTKVLADEIRAKLQIGVTEEKVNESLAFLADSLLLYLIPPFEGLGQRQSHPPKLCICDHFVRNGILQETLPIDPEALKECDEAVSGRVGHLIESILGYYLKGIPGAELSWFPARPNEPEVDFVLTIGTARIPVEVKYRRSAPGGTDLAGIHAFCRKKAYGADFGLVITQTAEGPIGDKAIAIPASTFLLLR
ncbi:MAG: ATP-binding protein [Phycisphaerales bacterium]|nr:ATP-binding protein [Phycisphaerales bacterium]